MAVSVRVMRPEDVPGIVEIDGMASGSPTSDFADPTSGFLQMHPVAVGGAEADSRPRTLPGRLAQ